MSQLFPKRESQPSVTSLHPRAEWVSGFTSGLKEVVNSESLELQSLFKSDHMVGNFCYLASAFAHLHKDE